MPKAGDIRVGSAWISITPELNQAQLKAELERAEREIAAFSGKQETLARQVSKLQAKLQTWVTAVYGEEVAKRVKLEQAAAAKRSEFNKTETAAYIRALTAVTEAEAAAEKARLAAKEKAARARERIALNARDLEVKYGNEAAASYLKSVEKMKASGKTMYLTRINEAKQWVALEITEQRKLAAEQERLTRQRAAQITGLSKLIVRQASIEAAEQTKAARTAQAAYTEAFTARKAQALAELEMQRSVQAATAQTALAQATAAKAAAAETIRQNAATVAALQANARKVDKSWIKATSSVGSNISRFGATMSEFGRNVNRNLVTPLMAAASAMSYLGIKSADSIIQSQTALQRMGVSNKDAATQINTLKTYGTETPYSVEDMFKYGTQYARAGSAHGLSSKKASQRATDLVQAIGNLSAYAGITDPAQVGRAMYAVSIMQDADRASLRNVKSLADNAGIPIQELAETFGFSNRAYTEKEKKAKLAQQARKGIKIALPHEYTASAQMMDWMADAKTTGGVPGEGIVTALLKRGQDPKIKGAAVKQGSATISARLSNMWEQAKFGLSDMFISPTGKDGAYQYTGAGEKLMGKGGLLDQISNAGAKLKHPAGKLIEEFFTDLEVIGGWLHSAVQVIQDHPAIADTVIKVGKWAAAIGAAAIAFGLLTKTVGLITKILSPLAGPAKLLFKGLKGGAKIASQMTGIGSQTDADKDAKSIRQRGKDEAAQIRKDAKGMSRNDRRIRNRYADQVERQAKQDAKDARRAGRENTSSFDRYRQRRTDLNGGDDRSAGRRAVDRVRGRNSQTDRIEVDTSEAQESVKKLDREIGELKARIQELKTQNLKQLADTFAGQDSSVKAKAEAAAKAVREAETAVKNLRSLQLQNLHGEFEKVTKSDNELKSSVKRAEAAVSSLNTQKLGSLDGEVDDSKSRISLLISAVKSGIKQVNTLDGKSLGKVKGEVDNVKDAADSASKKFGSGNSSLISRVGQLNGLKTSDVVAQIENLRKKLKDTADQADTLNTKLDNISKHAPEGGKGKGKGSSGKSTKKALGGVLPGYTPGRDVHKFVSPTAGVLELSGGESVMRPEWTVAAGPDYVNRMNAAARQGGVNGVRKAMKFASGGMIGKLGLNDLVDAAKDFNIGSDALAAFQTMTMDATTRVLGGDTQKGVIGAGTDGSHFIGSDMAGRFQGMYDFITKDSWKILKKLPIPDGWSQVIGILGGAMTPITGEYFWNDVWKGQGNILQRGAAYMSDLFSFKTLKGVVSNLFGGLWDSGVSLLKGGKALLTDPIGTVEDSITGLWDLGTSEYDGLIDMVKTLREVVSSPYDYASQVWGDVYTNAKESLPNLDGLFDFSGDHLTAKKPDVSKLVDDQFGTPAPAGTAVTRWTPQVKMALAQLGLPASALGLVLHRIQVESGGNPKAINLWDINAKMGHPSQGLMQTIPGTFNAYAGPYRSRGITDPMASIYAGLNYAVHRYGSGWMKALSGVKGYATGTPGADKGWAWVGEEGPELVNFKGGETVLNHQDSMLATVKVLKGYATGTSTKRTSGVAADAEKGVSSLNSAVKKLYEIIKKAFTSGRIGSGTANSLNKWLDRENKSLQKLVKERADLAPKLKDANAKLAAIKKDEAEMASSISDKAKGLRSLTDVFNSDGVSVSGGLSSLHERLAAIKSFQSDISALAKKGFSKEIISEIAEAGPEQGDAMAKELLKSTAVQVADYNKTYADIGTASDSLGKTVADSYYSAGKKAAQSLVDGLTAKDNALKKKIEGIADTIVKTLKKKLHFNSKTPVDSVLASLLTWLTGEGQAVKGGDNTSKKKTTRVTTSYSTDSQGRKVTTVTTTVTDPAKGTTTTTTERTVGGKTTKSTKVTHTKAYATGTRSAAPGIALVGERGPELVRFNGGERVDNARDTAQLMGPRYEIHIHEAKSEDTTQAVLRAMKYAEVMAGM
ncbi:transglycosylase SLT domain-containing protein [Streptomyces longwoodensis]